MNAATAATEVVFGWAEWRDLFLHYFSLSLLSVGGAITTAPDMHRFLVEQRQWLTDAQFSASIAIAQAAPGPNVLFIALMGWHIGMNTGSMAAALLGVSRQTIYKWMRRHDIRVERRIVTRGAA